MARRRPRRRLSLLLLLLLLLLLFKLNPFLAGVLPGGGRWRDESEDALRPGVLEVWVFDREERAPVAGATILLAGLDGSEQQRRTDTAGRARFAGLPSEPVRVEARGPGGFASAWSKPGRRVEVRLAPRPARTGRVRDAAGTARSAEVVLLDRDARILARARTAADGTYELPDDPAGIAVCAWPDEGAPASSADGDIVIGEGVRHEGEAMDAGAETMEVFALVPDSTADRVVPLRVSWPISEEGTYEGLLPRDAQAYSFFGSYATPLGEVHNVAMMQLARGRIVDEGGKPVPGVHVAARAMSRGMPVAPNPFAIERETDAGGWFDLGWGPNTRYELELSAPGRARLLVPLPRDVGTITLPKGFRIGGQVVDESDRPVAGARVDALPTPDPDGRFLAARTRSTQDGRFHAGGIGGEYARVRVSKPGYAEAQMDRVPPEGFVTIRLRRAE